MTHSRTFISSNSKNSSPVSDRVNSSLTEFCSLVYFCWNICFWMETNNNQSIKSIHIFLCLISQLWTYIFNLDFLKIRQFYFTFCRFYKQFVILPLWQAEIIKLHSEYKLSNLVLEDKLNLPNNYLFSLRYHDCVLV